MLQRIKDLCESHSISLAQLERDTNIGSRSTFNWKKHSPSIDKVIAIADYFGVSLDYLTGREQASSTLSLPEQELINTFRSLNKEAQEQLERYAEFLSTEPLCQKKHSEAKLVEENA